MQKIIYVYSLRISKSFHFSEVISNVALNIAPLKGFPCSQYQYCHIIIKTQRLIIRFRLNDLVLETLMPYTAALFSTVGRVCTAKEPAYIVHRPQWHLSNFWNRQILLNERQPIK